ncbi:MAG: butyrate kinase [Bacillota bacterium]
MEENLILAINPGSTSTKLGLYEGRDEIFTEKVVHKAEELKDFEKITDQMDLRLDYILDFLKQKNVNLNKLNAVVGRGGLLKPIPGGTYSVNDKMAEDLKAGLQGEHASNLGGLLARAIGEKAGCPSFIVDPVVVDELKPEARLSGLPELDRRSIFHALNQKAVARKYAEEKEAKYKDLNIIVAHLGGGISVGIHHKGKVIDVNNALSGEGPFSPNRSGGLPTLDLFELCYSDKFKYNELKKKLVGNGGVMAYLGTNDMEEVEEKVKNGDEKARLVFDSMVYQTGKEIGSLAPIVNGNIDVIILTGGIAYSEYFTERVSNMVKYIAPVKIYPGEEELAALASGAFRVLSGKEEAKVYE